ncbi:ATP-dependent Clp protease protease subunit [Catenuloplanes nepalensis]|uniref:ATP-dependent Clp protease proteolytic subunit n=1 Tax=Catenuloplanes nepalensis TaxID=587533 RepID=A0ABT9MLI4_9ACTN|nr:ATP-dependent Clp protease proteolytic subunit [Catenuloplanes nepalensis]MDP9792282.1 ATP-dependent Clp protease protease subunit [Catenuloplanes nepalensis]
MSDPRRWPQSEPDPYPHQGLSPWLEERLFDQRIVMLRGRITLPAATQAAAALFSLDSAGDAPVQIHLACPDGELAAAFAVVDAMDTMRSPVHVVVTSEAGGAALALLAAAQRRLGYRHARFKLSEPHASATSGTTEQVTAAAGQYLRELEELALRLAEATGQTRHRIEDDLGAGRMLTAEEARDYGLLHEIVGKP